MSSERGAEIFDETNGIWSYIRHFGSLAECRDTKALVFVIPGNPGQNEFYTNFGFLLHEKLKCEIPVYISGHLGHVDYPRNNCLKHPPDQHKPDCLCTRNLVPLKGNEQLYDLNAQVQHKIQLINKHLMEGYEIIFIGHSIGCWMILELLKKPEIRNKTLKCYMLFPTIERMAESPNGKKFCRLTSPLYPVLRLMAKFFNWMSKGTQDWLCENFMAWFMSDLDSAERLAMRRHIKAFINPETLDRNLALAREEMARVRDLDIQTIEKNRDILKFYYGASDGWVPVKYYEELCEKIPGIDAEVDNTGMDHAFVLKSSREMACIVAEWIEQLKEM